VSARPISHPNGRDCRRRAGATLSGERICEGRTSGQLHSSADGMCHIVAGSDDSGDIPAGKDVVENGMADGEDGGSR
jgi:hypothetical protein